MVDGVVTEDTFHVFLVVMKDVLRRRDDGSRGPHSETGIR